MMTYFECTRGMERLSRRGRRGEQKKLQAILNLLASGSSSSDCEV